MNLFFARLGLDKKKLTMYGIAAVFVVLLFVVVGFNLALKGDSTTSPIVTTKIRASLLTYKRTIVIGGPSATPTPRKLITVTEAATPTTAATRTTISPATANPTAGSSQSGSGSTSGSTSGGSQSGQDSSTASPTPTDTVIFDNTSPTQNPTPTDGTLIALNGSPTDAPTATPDSSSSSVSDTPTPTKAASLPQTGSVQYPIIMFISATVLLFVAFLF